MSRTGELLVLPSLTRIASARQNLGWSQAILARKVGLKQGTVSKIERGEYYPSYKTLEKIFTVLNDAIMGPLDPTRATAQSIMNAPVESVSSSDRVIDAISKMTDNGYSNLAVIRDGTNVGRITENIILTHALTPNKLIQEISGPRFAMVNRFATFLEVKDLLLQEPAVLVGSNDNILGIITKHDIFAKVKLELKEHY
ncbi:MAG: helix-turn-helix domain-containing protein [Nitrososphaera sp.]